MYRGEGNSRSRLGVALLVAVFALISYFSQSAVNPVTGEKQIVAMSVPEEISLGLQARSEMAAQYGGLDPDRSAQARVKGIGEELLAKIGDSPYHFDFHLLADRDTINAFALPGGQVFITRALYQDLKTDGQLAGVLGHEIGHVIERHSAQQLAKTQLTQGLTGAAVIAASDPEHGDARRKAMLLSMIGHLVNLRYGRKDEIESDRWGVSLTAQAGYNPFAMLDVMDVLEKSAARGAPPEFLSTHPAPENRKALIAEELKRKYPEGLPRNLRP